MSKFRYTVPVCEREWESRSLAELVELLTHRYRKGTRQRIDAIATVLPRILSSTRERREAYGRLATVFTSLSELIDTHAPRSNGGAIVMQSWCSHTNPLIIARR